MRKMAVQGTTLDQDEHDDGTQRSFFEIVQRLFVILGALFLSAYSLSLELPDKPEFRSDPANVVFSVDNSGSMDHEVLFNTKGGMLLFGPDGFYNRSKSEFYADGGFPRYGFLFPFPPYSAHTPDGQEEKGYTVPPFPAYAFARSPDYNPMYYDPRKEYVPWEPYYSNGQLIAFSDACDNIASCKARSHPIIGGRLTLELAKSQYNGGKEYQFDISRGMTVDCRIRNSLPSCKGTKNSVIRASSKDEGPQTVEYTPATFWLVDDTCKVDGLNCAVGPDGHILRKYDITQMQGSSYQVPTSKLDPTPLTIARNREKELKNFANWFTYYRKRRLLAGGALGFALREAGKIGNIRAFVDLLKPARGANKLTTLDGTDNSKNFRSLLAPVYTMRAIGGGTPIPPAMNQINSTYARAVQVTAAPKEALTCQRYNTVILTDGYSNYPNVSIPKLSPSATKNWFSQKPYTNVAGTSNGIDNAGFQGTMTHIASYYYGAYDMKSALGIKGSAPKLVIDKNNNDPTYDKNDLPHMNTFGITIGALGKYYAQPGYGNPYKTQWNWIPPGDFQPTAIDDLWHATINGRGDMLTATDGMSLASGMLDILGRMSAQDSRTAVTVPNTTITSGGGTYFAYVTNFSPGRWTGDVQARTIGNNTGLISNNSIWSASAQLDNTYKDDLIPPGNGQTWGHAYTNRKIVSYSGTSGIEFTPSVLSNLLGNTYNATFSTRNLQTQTLRNDANNVINYIRGDRSLEYNGTSNGGKGIYPGRASLLRDIVDSQPAYVSNQGLFNYTLMNANGQPQDPGYALFQTSPKVTGRKPAIYVGANDGMMHAFDVHSGDELWAYVPKNIWNKLSKLATVPYLHTFTVDGPIVAGDVDFHNAGSANATGSGDWHTIVVGTLRAGGIGIYALDVTDTNTSNLQTVAGKVLWEFPNATSQNANIGYLFGKPVIVKTPDHRWVVLVASGYNNGDGNGHLYVLDAKTGGILKDYKTMLNGSPAGTRADPLNLGNIGVLYENDPRSSALVQFVYAGDLKGNVWRFDLSKETHDAYASQRLLAGLPPISTAPIAMKLVLGGQQRNMVYAGTGKNLEKGDLSSKNKDVQEYVIGFQDAGQSTTITLNNSNNMLTSSNLISIATTTTGGTDSCADVNGKETNCQTNDVWHADNIYANLSKTSQAQAKYQWWTQPGKQGFLLPLKPGDQVVTDMIFWNNLLVFSTTAGVDPTVICADTMSALYSISAGTGTEPAPSLFPTTEPDGTTKIKQLAWSRADAGPGIAGSPVAYSVNNHDLATISPGGAPYTNRLPGGVKNLVRLGWREVLR